MAIDQILERGERAEGAYLAKETWRSARWARAAEGELEEVGPLIVY